MATAEHIRIPMCTKHMFLLTYVYGEHPLIRQHIMHKNMICTYCYNSNLSWQMSTMKCFVEKITGLQSHLTPILNKKSQRRKCLSIFIEEEVGMVSTFPCSLHSQLFQNIATTFFSLEHRWNRPVMDFINLIMSCEDYEHKWPQKKSTNLSGTSAYSTLWSKLINFIQTTSVCVLLLWEDNDIHVFRNTVYGSRIYCMLQTVMGKWLWHYTRNILAVRKFIITSARLSPGVSSAIFRDLVAKSCNHNTSAWIINSILLVNNLFLNENGLTGKILVNYYGLNRLLRFEPQRFA